MQLGASLLQADDGMPTGVTDRSLIKHAHYLLSEPRVAVVPLTQQLTATLKTASTAFQGQLHCWAERAPSADYTGFQLFPQKRRAEFRVGHATQSAWEHCSIWLSRYRMLHLFSTVWSLKYPFSMSSVKLVSCSNHKAHTETKANVHSTGGTCI